MAGTRRLERVGRKCERFRPENALYMFGARARFSDQAIPPDPIVLSAKGGRERQCTAFERVAL